MGHYRAQGRGRQRHLCRFFTTALDFVARNAAANGVAVDTIKDDAFDALKALQESGARFDVVILDPPAFAKRKKDVPQAQAAYRKLNQLALPLIERDGLLVSCSCSYHMGADELVSAIQGAARHSSRFVQVLELGGQSPDHPRASGHSRNSLPQIFFLPRHS